MPSDSSTPTAPIAPERLEAAVHASLCYGADARPVLLAVSGGVDSMTLLACAAATARGRIAAVATFDHGTGADAERAAALVVEVSAALGLRVVVGRASLAGGDEATWRDARWRFLRDTARDLDARAVATAHTRDDQIETIVMRVLRGAGARGLAGLAAPSADVARPFLHLDRASVEAYARRRGLRWIDDPSNHSRRHLRNRVRHDLLPALRRARPDIDESLLATARAAVDWRRDVDAFIDAHVDVHTGKGGALHVASAGVAGYDPEALAVLWPAIAARAGVRLDRRGTDRLVHFTTGIAAGAAVGAEMQLSGAIDVRLGRGEIVLGGTDVPPGEWNGGSVAVALVGDAPVGPWRFRRIAAAQPSVWTASLPSDRPLAVRPWRPGDRMCISEARPARRVKRFLADARIPGRVRPGWPVVMAGDDIVWIPGVRRSDAATDRPGRPGVHYICERIDG